MANLKSLAKDTAIYGLSSIAGRFINYLLVPIQTTAFVASGGQYGVVTDRRRRFSWRSCSASCHR